MHHVLQTKAQTQGNCLNACIASILEIPLESIPPFNEIQDNSQWWFAVQDWAATVGFQFVYITLNAHTAIAAIPAQVLCILVGPSEDKKIMHAVVGYARGGSATMDFMQLHDPLDKQGLNSVEGVIYFTPIHPEKKRKRPIQFLNGEKIQTQS